MDNVFFSIIIPVYNLEKYVKECIDSILSQEYKNYEIILINDGSTDKSGEICDEYSKKNSNIKVIHKKNAGLSEARNDGIKMAQGKYIMFVDGDDYIAPNSIKSIMSIIEQGDYPDVVCLECTKFFENSSKTVPMQDGVDEKINNLVERDLYEYLSNLPKYPAAAWSKAIKRELFLSNDLFFIKGLLSEDLEWCIRLFMVAKTFKYCPEEYYMYRQARAGSISNTPSEKKTMDILSTFDKWTQYALKLENLSQKKMIASFMEYIFRFLILGYKNIDKKKRKLYINQLVDGKWVLGTRKDKISRYIRVSYKILGIKATSILLEKYLIMRGY